MRRGLPPLLLALLLAWLVAGAGAATGATPGSAPVRIPQASYLYRFKLAREVSARFGSTHAVARVAAQVHQESAWRPDARSPYAEGMAQFTPGTARWIVGVCPEIGAPDPYDPNWSVRAAVCYDAWLHARVRADNACARWAMTLSAYNGGLGWVRRDQRQARARGVADGRWFGAVATTPDRRRAPQNIAENRQYVQRILQRLEPAYLAAGWPGRAVCA